MSTELYCLDRREEGFYVFEREEDGKLLELSEDDVAKELFEGDLCNISFDDDGNVIRIEKNEEKTLASREKNASLLKGLFDN